MRTCRGMKIPTFWARQTVDGMVAYGWSFNSQQEAEENARANAREIASRYVAGALPDRGKMYYANRPVREPIMREFQGPNGEVDAILTRNVYGALVLNAAKALFVDVDYEAEGPRCRRMDRSFEGTLCAENPGASTA
jgi:hypothetical protein